MLEEINNYRELTFNLKDKEITVIGMASPFHNDDNIEQVLLTLHEHGISVIFSLEAHRSEIIKDTFLNISPNNKHFTINIPDFHPPTIKQFNFFFNTIGGLPNKTKIAVHCLAGIGRTGTMLSSLSLLEQTTSVSLDSSSKLMSYDFNINRMLKIKNENYSATNGVYQAITRIRSLRNSEHSVETIMQIDALMKLEKSLILKHIPK
jgi:protein-tyrosine phosphatase